MNFDLQRNHFGDVHGSIASHNMYYQIYLDGTGTTLLGKLDDPARPDVTYNSQLRGEGYSSSLRSPPDTFIGRDETKVDIIRTLLHSEMKSVLVLGGGGIGKTAVALTVLHDQAIIDHFGGSRCFMSCEGLDNMDMFLQRLAEILGLAASIENKSLESQILTALRSSNVLLCIDNLETIWDSPHTRRIEEVIAKLIHLPTVAMLVTMRGIQRPLEPKWEAVHELKPLFKSPSQIFCSTAGIPVENIDNHGKLLVEAVDGVPLALTLLGHLIRTGVDTPKDVWERWRKRKTAILNREKGTRDPHLSIDTSIEFSLESQRVRADPFAKAALGILSLLPDGIPRDSKLDIINSLGAIFPGDRDLNESLLTLTDFSLAFVENSPSRRYKILSPVKEYARSRLDSILPRNQQTEIVRCFVRLIKENRHYEQPRCFPVREELINVHSILTFAYESWDDIVTNNDLACASIDYTNWTKYIGAPVEDIICLAEKRFRKDIGLLSNIYHSHGVIHFYRDKLDDAEVALTTALELHRRLHDAHGQANDLQILGEMYIRLDRLGHSEKVLMEALELYRQAQSLRGQADVLLTLGNLYLRLNKLDHTKKALTDALELDQLAQDMLGQANDLLNLGELYVSLDKPDCAEKALQEALELYQQAQSSPGQANVFKSLGTMYLRLDKLDHAEEMLTKALRLHQLVQDSLGQANDLRNLGKLYMKLENHDCAEKELKGALRHYRQAESSLGQGNAWHDLGELYMTLERLHDAEEALTKALKFHQEAQESSWQTADLEDLCNLYTRLGNADLAEKASVEARELRQRRRSTIGRAKDPDIPGEVKHGEVTHGKFGSGRRTTLNFHKSILKIIPWRKKESGSEA